MKKIKFDIKMCMFDLKFWIQDFSFKFMQIHGFSHIFNMAAKNSDSTKKSLSKKKTKQHQHAHWHKAASKAPYGSIRINLKPVGKGSLKRTPRHTLDPVDIVGW